MMVDLAPRHAAVEYWFFRFRAGDLSFLVDFIRRAASPRNVEVRLSYWLRGQGSVEGVEQPSEASKASIVATSDASLQPGSSSGIVGAASWQLTWELGASRLQPRPWLGSRFYPGDLEILTFPAATFSGWVDIGGERIEVRDRPGLVTHYWGRRLPDRWTWLSASEFPDQPGRRVEALQAWGRTWGRGPSWPFGYVWITDGQHGQLTMSPVNGLVGVETHLDASTARQVTTIRSSRLDGKRHELVMSAPMASFNDLREGISQTLLADLAIDGSPAAPSTVGLEYRRAP